MAGKKKTKTRRAIETYEHTDKERVNNPPVGLVTSETDPEARKKKTYQYDPHLDPQLQWAGKAEHTSFEVPTVSLHLHERIDPRSIIEAVKKRNGKESGSQLSLFESQRKEPLRQAIEFYRHAHGWSNRLIAGDSLVVMNSLLEKEGMAGKVQMIYIDPPYGIKYGSNFQPFVNRRGVTDGKDDDLTGEPEQIRAFRDTWELGVHSYLTYFRDRLLLVRELLHESGSVFVQISEENFHHLIEIMAEIFGSQNHLRNICFVKTSSATSNFLPSTYDHLIWFSKNKKKTKFKKILLDKSHESQGAGEYQYFLTEKFELKRFTKEDLLDKGKAKTALRVDNLTSQSGGVSTQFVYQFKGKRFFPKSGGWKTNFSGMERLGKAGRLHIRSTSLNYKRFLGDFPALPLSSLWTDTAIAGWSEDKKYVVQTARRVIERCMLMTTDPGDIVLDPTCGSGTTAFVAEQWGRRWISCDTSRVALTLARQRLMTATFDYYELAHPKEGVSSGFNYKTVPHITLKSIANNPEIDDIHAHWQAKLDPVREELNTLLKKKWEEWEVPREPGKAWPEKAKRILKNWWDLRQKRQQEMDHSIARYAPQETLYDQPRVDRKRTRVSGPFTVEAVPAPRVKPVDDLESPEPEDAHAGVSRSGETLRQSDWRDELLKTGIRGKRGQHIRFARLEPLPGFHHLHAEGETRPNDEGTNQIREGAGATPQRIVVSFGPEHGPMEPRQVDQAVQEAQTLVPKPALVVFAAFQFDSEAAKDIEELKWPGVTLLKVQMNADLLTEDLKKKRTSNESFWLIGQPDVAVSKIDFLVSGSQRIADLETFRNLSGLKGLEDIQRLGWSELFFHALLAQGKEVWSFLQNQCGWDFKAGKVREKIGRSSWTGRPVLSWNHPNHIGGIGNFNEDLKPFGISSLNFCRKALDRLQKDKKLEKVLEELAKELNFPNLQAHPLKIKPFYRVSVHGFDYYNTKSGDIESGGPSQIAVWMLDTDYDGRSLFPRQVFFPMAGKTEGWAKLAKNLKAEIDEELMEAYRGTESLLFPSGGHRRIAVKIVDDRGIESLKMLGLDR